MSQPPATPVKVPSSAASYTPATLDPDMRSQVNSMLLRDGHIGKIQESLLHALNSDDNNWPTLVQNHALNLLRSGEVSTYPNLLRRVLEDIRNDSLSTTSTSTNGEAKTNGNGSATANGNSDNPGGLAIPQSVIDEALKTTRESLEAVCEMEDPDGSG